MSMFVWGVGLFTGSSNFRSREKNRMKSTAEVLVMVYLQGRDGRIKNPRRHLKT